MMPVRASLALSVTCSSNFILLVYIDFSLSFLRILGNREIDGMFHLFVGEREVPYIGNILHIVEFHSLAIDLRNLLNVFLIVLTDHDIGNTGSLGGQNLLLDATYGENFSTKCYLSCHGCVLSYLALC